MMEKAMEVLERVLPGRGQAFLLEIIEPDAGQDVFAVDRQNGKILLRGNNTISLCMALHWYLKYVARVHLSWCGSRMDLPEHLPLPEQPYRQVVVQKYRSYMNYCTFNYSASWWDFERWEKELDFMALCGVNLAAVYRRHGRRMAGGAAGIGVHRARDTGIFVRAGIFGVAVDDQY